MKATIVIKAFKRWGEVVSISKSETLPSGLFSEGVHLKFLLAGEEKTEIGGLQAACPLEVGA